MGALGRALSSPPIDARLRPRAAHLYRVPMRVLICKALIYSY
jgi:hypothetical protein